MSKSANILLFTHGETRKIGIGYPNIQDVLRASDQLVHKKVQVYAQRCGHIPLDNVENTYDLVSEHTDEITSQLQYLSRVINRTITPKTPSQIREEMKKYPGSKPLSVPYIKVPETENYLKKNLGDVDIWGLPAEMANALKNKADLHERINKSNIEGLHISDFIISNIDELPVHAEEFLQEKVEKLYKKYGIGDYEPGLMLRFAECDGNYGVGIIKSLNNKIMFLPDGNESQGISFTNWNEAFLECKKFLKTTMNMEKEKRVVISRLIDSADSPAMSVAIIDGEIISLGLNSQIQTYGSACVGTETYKPRSEYLNNHKEEYEKTVSYSFEKLLRGLAQEEGIDMNNIRGFANIDIIIPSEKERELQIKRFGNTFLYISESNPRFTNWTDGVLTGVAVQKKPQTVRSMLEVIKDGIQNVDKFILPAEVDPGAVREEIYKKDQELKNVGIRIIARMTASPMGVIFMGDLKKAREELEEIIKKLVG